MSRRKQAKPRLVKTDDDDQKVMPTLSPATLNSPKNNERTTESSSMDATQDPEDVTTCPVITMDMSPPRADSVPSTTHEMDTPPIDIRPIEGTISGDDDTTAYRCEACSKTLYSLNQFMDHCNFECINLDNTDLDSRSGIDNTSRLDCTPSPGGSTTSTSVPDSPTVTVLNLSDLPSSKRVNAEFQHACAVCDRAFIKSSHLYKHEQIHTDTLRYHCVVCTRVFPNRKCRDEHLKSHRGEHRYRCPYCDAAYPRRESLKAHIQTHLSDTSTLLETPAMLDTSAIRPYSDLLATLPCPVCQMQCHSAAIFYSHLSLHEEEKIDSIKTEPVDDQDALLCPLCRLQLPGVTELRHHIFEQHLNDDGDSEASNDSKRRRLQCNICDDVIDGGSRGLQGHMMLNHPQNVPTGGDVDDLQYNIYNKTYQAVVNIPGYSSVKDTVSSSANPTTHNLYPPHGPFNCPFCDKGNFSNSDVLEIHLHTMHGTSVGCPLFTCQYCSAVMPSKFSLQSHIRSQHPATLECRGDPPQNNKRILHGHAKPSNGLVFCPRCSVGFQSQYMLAEHMRTVHKNTIHQHRKYDNRGGSTLEKRRSSAMSPSSYSRVERETLCCDKCQKDFTDLLSFEQHMKQHADIPKKMTGSTIYPCSECDAEFDTEEQMENHVFVHFLALTTEYGCSSCLKLFNKPDELQKHLMDIHAHHLYRCSLCKEIFDSKVNVQVHFAVKHSNECKLYKCTTCGSVFRSEMEWQLHVKVNHLGVSKPYRCLFCKESFGAEVELQCHLTTHKKQFPCPQCEEEFHVEYLLDKHVETCHFAHSNNNSADLRADKVIKREPDNAHGTPLDYSRSPPPVILQTGASPNKSRQTSPQKSPKSNDSLSPHLYNNTTREIDVKPNINSLNEKSSMQNCTELTHICDICDVKFCDDSTLQAHRTRDHSMSPEINIALQKAAAAAAMAAMNTITNENQQSSKQSVDKYNQLCVYCNKTFKTKNELEKHMKSHVSPANQKCNICDDIFPSATILAEHKLTHCKVTKGNICTVCKVPIKNDEQFYAHAQQHGFQGTAMQCIVCRQTLASMLELQMHAKHHFQVASTAYSCSVCVTSFNSRENLVSKLNADGKTFYVCKPCYHGEAPSTSALTSPSGGTGGTSPVICRVCSVVCESETQLSTHMTQHHKKSYQCIKCQQAFNTEYEIQVHVATHMMQEGNKHDCLICNLSFDSPAKLQCHLIEHTFDGGSVAYRCYVCAAVFQQSSDIQMHVLEHGVTARQYVCPQCPQKFFFNGELQNHILSHTTHTAATGLPPSGTPSKEKCFECGREYSTRSALIAHMQRDHMVPTAPMDAYADGATQCTACPESFTTVREMHRHFASYHMSDKDLPRQTFCCFECGKEHPNVRSLQAHMKTHKEGNADTLACRECGKEFSDKKGLLVHSRMHTDNKEKPYECPICLKRFTRKENRKAHLKCHTKPYICPVCLKLFARRGHVRDHLKVHYSQALAPYNCDFCGEICGDLRTICEHVLTKHGKQETKCRVCNETFDDDSQLQKHLFSIHGIEDEYITETSYTENLADDNSDSLNSDLTCQNGDGYTEITEDLTSVDDGQNKMAASSPSNVLSSRKLNVMQERVTVN